jgi:predicted phosphodiesterase
VWFREETMKTRKFQTDSSRRFAQAAEARSTFDSVPTPPESGEGTVAAIMVSDTHFSHDPPRARSGEKDWYGCMGRQLKELRELQEKYRCPVLHAGDLFDRWNSPHELVNFLMDRLPLQLYAVCGNHDLPNHRIEDIGRSAFWTLCRAGRITPLMVNAPVGTGSLRLWGFPAGWERMSLVIDPRKAPGSLALDVAVCHGYLYRRRSEAHPKAAESGKLSRWKALFAKFDAAVTGDNHATWKAVFRVWKKRKVRIFNPGAMYRRDADQQEQRPVCGLLLPDGRIKVHRFDCRLDVLSETGAETNNNGEGIDLAAFIAELRKNSEKSALDFRESVKRYLDSNPVPDGARRAVLEALEEVK